MGMLGAFGWSADLFATLERPAMVAEPSVNVPGRATAFTDIGSQRLVQVTAPLGLLVSRVRFGLVSRIVLIAHRFSLPAVGLA